MSVQGTSSRCRAVASSLEVLVPWFFLPSAERVALAAFIRRTQADVWRLCAHLVDVEEADDLAQETYLRAHRALVGFRAEASARTWLLAIARRTCADAIRRRQRTRRFRTPVGPSPVSPDPSGTVDVASLLGRLDPDRRTAFVLTQLLRLTYREAAEVMEVRIGTIRFRVARARGELIALLEAAERDARD